MEERRKSLRVPDSRTISVISGGTTFDAHLTNLSTLGALVEATAAGVTVGATVQLKFPVAAGGKLAATGRIVRVGVPPGTIAFAFDRPLQEFPVEQMPAQPLPSASFEPSPKSSPIAAGCLIATLGLGVAFAIGALVLAFKG